MITPGNHYHRIPYVSVLCRNSDDGMNMQMFLQFSCWLKFISKHYLSLNTQLFSLLLRSLGSRKTWPLFSSHVTILLKEEAVKLTHTLSETNTHGTYRKRWNISHKHLLPADTPALNTNTIIIIITGIWRPVQNGGRAPVSPSPLSAGRRWDLTFLILLKQTGRRFKGNQSGSGSREASCGTHYTPDPPGGQPTRITPRPLSDPRAVTLTYARSYLFTFVGSAPLGVNETWPMNPENRRHKTNTNHRHTKRHKSIREEQNTHFRTTHSQISLCFIHKTTSNTKSIQNT